MSPFLEFIALPKVLQAYAIPSAICGIPLLWRFLSHKPVTRRQIGHVVWTIVIVGHWILLGNAAFDAYKRGMISLLAAVIAEAVLFAIVAGGLRLVERHYPQESES